MLKHVYIKNFTIIDELDLELFGGLAALTGETGAGKSIIVDAIELALGQRASYDVVRTGEHRANICVTFDVADNVKAQKFLEDNALNDGEECIIRRVIDKDGRSRSSVNSIPITQQMLRSLSESLINIHGQHEFQTLLRSEHQRILLDEFAHHDDLLREIKDIYTKWRSAKEEFEVLYQNHQDVQSKMDFLNYQIQEFQALNLQENEVDEIHQEYQQLSHADLLLNQCRVASEIIDGHRLSALDALNRADQAIASVVKYYPALQEMSESINSIVVQTQEVAKEIDHLLERVDLNPERLGFLESRLGAISDLAKKHRVNPEDLIEVYQTLCKNFSQLKSNDERLQILESEITRLEHDYDRCAEVLSESRKKAAQKLSLAVSKNIRKLGMPQGKFEIVFEPVEYRKPTLYGLEKVMFLVSANAGQPLRALIQVASGGELSRISLAVQVVTAQCHQTPTVIFDEVDAGIGGAIAEIVGQLLRELGQVTQVFCITHLPQVAAKSHYHLQVEKIMSRSNIVATVRFLNAEQKIQEIARMLGGLKITAQTLAHAKEMVEMV
jgi:DNA repair protein RecN (Recombination protein N)